MMDKSGTESGNAVTIRPAAEGDYDAVERIMKQVHRMHVDWRPDIYIDTDPVLPYDRYLARTGWAKTPREKGKRLYMLAYHMLDYITVICPALRWEIGKRIGMRMLGERKQ